MLAWIEFRSPDLQSSHAVLEQDPPQWNKRASVRQPQLLQALPEGAGKQARAVRD